MVDRDTVVAKLKEYFASRPVVRLAWLFGSVVSGRQMAESDVDVAAWLEEGYTYSDIAGLHGELERLLKRDVDFVVLNDANPMIALEAVNGISVCVRNEKEQLERMVEIWRAAEDWHEFVESYVAELRRARGEGEP